MKYIKIVILLLLLIYAWNFFSDAQKYNANNPNSLEGMLKLTSPNDRMQLLEDFYIAAEGDRGINLHGMTKEEIHKVAEGKRAIIKRNKVTFLKLLVKRLKGTGRSYVVLNSNATGFPAKDAVGKEFTIEELEAELKSLL